MRTLGFAIALALAGGCAGPDPVRDLPVELHEADPAGVTESIRERRGRVVLVDFWATWCPPCRARFPHFVETHRQYKDKGLVCVSVSMDKAWPHGREYNRDRVLEFLKDKGAAFANLVATSRDDDEFAKQFGLRGGIPHMALFGKDGRRVWDSGQRDLDDLDIAALVERELMR